MLRRVRDDARGTLPTAAEAGWGRWWLGWWSQQASLAQDGTRRLLLSLILAAAIPMLLFGGVVLFDSAREDRALARAAASETAHHVAERIAAELSTQLQMAEGLAASTALDGPDLAAFYLEAERLNASRPLWHSIQLADPSGAQVLNLLRSPDAQLGPTADVSSFRRVIQTGRPAIGAIGPAGPVSGRQLVALRVPVIRHGSLHYVLSVVLAPDGVRSILQTAGAPEGWVGIVVDAEGRIIAQTLDEEIEAGSLASQALRDAVARAPAGFYSGRTLRGVEVETVYRPLLGTDSWTVHFGIPSEMLNTPVNRSLYVLAGGGFASLALAAGLAFLATREIAQRRQDEAARSAMALRSSEERWAVAVEAADLGTWRWNVKRGEVIGSERCRALLDLPSGTGNAGGVWPIKRFLSRVHPGDRAILLGAVRNCLEKDAPIDVEFRVVGRNGSSRWVRARGRGQQLQDGSPAAVHGVLADVEPQKRAAVERLDLLRRLGQAQEDERRRIARELHDQVGQTVTGLSLGLKGLERTLEREAIGQEAQGQVRWLQTLTSEVGRDVHRVASDLRPTALDDLGLAKALEARASDWGERYGLAVDVQAYGIDGRLPAEIETTVYRVVQEALTNVLKHAAARSVSVVLERKADQLRVIVEDDGKGFDVEATGEAEQDRPAQRLGLSGIRERLTLVGGTMTLESAPDTGTSLFVRIPLAPERPGAGR